MLRGMVSVVSLLPPSLLGVHCLVALLKCFRLEIQRSQPRSLTPHGTFTTQCPQSPLYIYKKKRALPGVILFNLFM